MSGGGGGGGGSQTTQVVESAESRRLSKVTADISRDLWDTYKQFGLPALKRFTSDVEGYGSPARLAAESGMADSVVAEAYADERADLTRSLGRYGARPGSGRFAGALRSLALGEAKDRAGARTGSRIGVLDRALGHRLSAINAWAGNPSQALSGLGSARSGLGRTETTRSRSSGGGGEALGQIAGTLLGWAIWSDRRLKTDITKIDELPSGLPVYEFRLKGQEDGALCTGCMADEVILKHPAAVISEGGYLKVNYAAVISREMSIDG